MKSEKKSRGKLIHCSLVVGEGRKRFVEQIRCKPATAVWMDGIRGENRGDELTYANEMTVEETD